MTDSNITSGLGKLPPTHSDSNTSSLSSQKSKTETAKIDIYRPLSPSVREIRLLHILPQQPGSLLLGPDPISCALSHVSLDDKPTYHALSYTWNNESLGPSFEDPDDRGNSQGKEKMMVFISGFVLLDGQVVEVTSNLWVALWHLRRGANWFKENPEAAVGEFGERLEKENPAYFTYETPIWIDALCINQLDVPERNQQVQMMGSLYQNAQCVQSWTGLEVQEVGSLVDIMIDYYSRLHASETTEIEMEFGKLLLDETLQPCWSTLSSIWERPYWRRLWIVQEFLLGQQCTIHLGLRTINSDPFTWFVRYVKEVENKMVWKKGIVVFSAGEQGLPDCTTIQARRVYNGKAKISNIILVFADFNCSDPRDKIYSLLGLGGPKEYGIKVDYTLDADTVYINSIRQILKVDRDLLLICNPERYSCQCTKSQHDLSPLPSWVPDFKCLKDTHISIRTGISSNPSGHEHAVITDSHDSNVLVCKGLLIGTISKTFVHDPASFNPSSDDSIRALVRFASEATNASPGIPSSKPLPERLKALYAALTDNFHYAALTMDEATFIQYCTSSSPDKRPNDKAIKRLFSLFDMEALFSMRLAPLSPLVVAPTDDRLPHGPVFGKCYPFCQEGDLVVALYGRSTLLALRDDPANEGCRKVLGEVCVPDFSDGQAVGRFAEMDFELT